MPSIDTVLHFITTNPVVLYVAIGFIIGFIARFLMPGPDPMGIIKTTLLGIAGTVLAGYGAQYFGLAVSSPLLHWTISVLGALAILFIYRFIRSV